ncbi:ABC transporter permease [Leucobacter sp. 7(1)]|uniref:ABC transporter permease n=1 Tax=Leucobacter sp. 7(1) TaxID=1255613 RepID=UPI000B35135F|nr:ABC transporter permease [Leucobacter sp. 7(1)]
MSRDTARGLGSGSAAARAHARSKLRTSDLFTLGTVGLRAKPLRAALSALGIAIGVAAMVAVLGISASSQAKLEAKLAELGTNLFTAAAAEGTAGSEPVPLPTNAAARVERLPGILSATALGTLPHASVFRNEFVDPQRTGGITVSAADTKLLDVVGGSLASGTWLDRTTEAFPTVVLGFTAASLLGVSEADTNVWLGGREARVIGILEPVPLAPALDTSAIIGARVAQEQFGWDGHPSQVLQRVDEERVREVRDLAPAAISPNAPHTIAMSRPSDALAAQAAVDEVFTGMLVGLGSISLLVGAIGVANTMVISVIERRREIGLRRALGATRGHVQLQFLTEALVLSALGGLAGAGLGAGVTLVVALSNDWTPVVPPQIIGVAAAATLAVGAVAGLYPAVRASRTPPTAALSG